MLEDTPTQELIHKLNRETAKIPWSELQRHYARGAVVSVAAGQDLIAVAMAFARDDKHMVGDWLAGGQVARVSDQQAVSWLESNPLLWAVVVAPWVLVQEVADGNA